MKANGFLISLLLSGSSVLAQDYATQLTLSRSVTPGGGISDQKAVQAIVATNEVSRGATALYTAGQSVTLLPGFLAQAGSVFKATVAPVVPYPSVGDSPTLSLRSYPNPFVDRTTIEYSLPKSGPVRHTLLDVQGRVLQQSEEATDQSAGIYRRSVEADNLPVGVYLYRLQVGNQSRTLRLVKKP